MIQLKNPEQINMMRIAGRITGEALVLAGEAIKEGITTKHLDDIIRHHIEKNGARPSFLGYGKCVYLHKRRGNTRNSIC